MEQKLDHDCNHMEKMPNAAYATCCRVFLNGGRVGLIFRILRLEKLKPKLLGSGLIFADSFHHYSWA
jgi:hypothetical protein